MEKVKQRLAEIANYVDKVKYPLPIAPLSFWSHLINLRWQQRLMRWLLDILMPQFKKMPSVKTFSRSEDLWQSDTVVPEINKSWAGTFCGHINQTFNQCFKNRPTFPFTFLTYRYAALSSTGPSTSEWLWWVWRCGVILINVPSPRILSPPCMSSLTGEKSNCCPRGLTTTLSS